MNMKYGANKTTFVVIKEEEFEVSILETFIMMLKVSGTENRGNILMT